MGSFLKVFDSLRVDSFLHNWKAAIGFRILRVPKIVSWAPPYGGKLKFNMDGAAKGKPGLAGVGGVLRNNHGVVMAIISKSAGVKKSNEAEVIAILEELQTFYYSFHEGLIVESDVSNAVSHGCLLFQILLGRCIVFSTRTSFLVSSLHVEFQHISRSANNFADSLAKKGVDRSVDMVAIYCNSVFPSFSTCIPCCPFWGVLSIIFLHLIPLLLLFKKINISSTRKTRLNKK